MDILKSYGYSSKLLKWTLFVGQFYRTLKVSQIHRRKNNPHFAGTEKSGRYREVVIVELKVEMRVNVWIVRRDQKEADVVE